MTQAREFGGTIQSGRFVPDSAPGWLVALGSLEGKRVIVTLQKWYQKRTNRQNSRYFVAVLPVVAEILTQELVAEFGPATMPVSSKEAHEKCKKAFNGYRITSLGEIPNSTAKLSTVEFSAYTRKVEEWLATRWGVVVPERGESL